MIAVLSMWQNDAERDLETRVAHLLEKTSSAHPVRFIWVVGDSDDDTEARLRRLVRMRNHPEREPVDVEILRNDTGIEGNDRATRQHRSSQTINAAFAALEDTDDYACLHESDLRSPPDLLDLFLEAAGGAPIAGWPTLGGTGPRAQFYDIWAYRDLHGRPFDARPPYCRGYRRDRTFCVGSFGSAWMVPAEILRGRQIERGAIVELCQAWRREGIELRCDPRIPIEQPTALWTPA